MADQLITTNEIQSNDLIVAMIQKELIARSKIAPHLTDVSQFAVRGSSSITFPYASSFSVTKKVSGTPVEAKAITYSGDKLELDQHAVIQWIIEKRAQAQSVVDIEQDAAMRAARAHGKDFDATVLTSVAAGFYGTNLVTFSGNTNTTMDKNDIIDATVILEGLDFDIEDPSQMVLWISPTQRGEIQKISGFIDASALGQGSPLWTGLVGQILGIPVRSSSIVTTDEAWLIHKDAVTFGFQLGPEYDSQKDLENLGTRYSVDQLYGVKVMQSGKGIVKIYQA